MLKSLGQGSMLVGFWRGHHCDSSMMVGYWWFAESDEEQRHLDMRLQREFMKYGDVEVVILLARSVIIRLSYWVLGSYAGYAMVYG